MSEVRHDGSPPGESDGMVGAGPPRLRPGLARGGSGRRTIAQSWPARLCEDRDQLTTVELRVLSNVLHTNGSSTPVYVALRRVLSFRHPGHFCGNDGILESMKRFVRNCGWDEQKEGEGLEILRETVG